MKKLLFLLLLSVGSILSYAQADTTSAERVYHDAKQSIVEVANSLKGPANHVYRVYVRQQVVRSTVDLSVLLFFGAVFIIGIFYFKRTAKFDNYNNAENNSGFLYIGCIVCTCVWILVCAFCLSDILNGLINPEYYAISNLIEDIRGE